MDLDIMCSHFVKFNPILDQLFDKWRQETPGKPESLKDAAPHLSPDAPAVGATVTCTKGTWYGVPATYSFQFKGNGVNLGSPTAPGVTDGTYVVAAEDAGKAITCVVIGANEFGTAEGPPSNVVTVASAGTRAIAPHSTRS